jgi:hypothetical protein
MAETFYGDIAKAAELGGVDEIDITDAMVEIINNYINSEIRTDGFVSTSAIEYHDINKNSKKELILKKYPIVEDSVEITDNYQNDPVVLDPTTYIVDYETGIVQLKTTFTNGDNCVTYFAQGIKNVKVEYEHGFAEVPSIIVRLATLLMAKKAKISNQNADADGIKSYTIGNYSQSKDLAFLNVKSEFDSEINSSMKKAKILYYLE